MCCSHRSHFGSSHFGSSCHFGSMPPNSYVPGGTRLRAACILPSPLLMAATPSAVSTFQAAASQGATSHVGEEIISLKESIEESIMQERKLLSFIEASQKAMLEKIAIALSFPFYVYRGCGVDAMHSYPISPLSPPPPSPSSRALCPLCVWRMWS